MWQFWERRFAWFTRQLRKWQFGRRRYAIQLQTLQLFDIIFLAMPLLFLTMAEAAQNGTMQREQARYQHISSTSSILYHTHIPYDFTYCFLALVWASFPDRHTTFPFLLSCRRCGFPSYMLLDCVVLVHTVTNVANVTFIFERCT